MQKSLGLDGSRFVVDPDVDGKWDRVAFKTVGSEEEGDELGDLQGDTFFVRKLGSTCADDDCVPERLRNLGENTEKHGVRGPGLVEVDGDGEVFGHCKQNEVNPDESESKQTAIPRTIYASSSKCLFES